MTRRLLTSMLLLTSAAICGCKDRGTHAGGPATPAGNGTADATPEGRQAPSSPPTAGHPWSQAEVEAWLKDDLGLVQVSLTSTGGDNYAGTGKDAAGTPYMVKVTQRPGRIVCEHQSPARTAPGKFTTGKIEFGH